MKKHLLLLIIAVIFSSTNVFADDGGTIPPLTWEYITATGTLTISGNGAMPDVGSTPPWYLYQSSINTVVIQSGVTSIARSAFANCMELKTVEIVEGSMTLSFGGGLGSGSFPFDGCANIQNVSLGRNISYYDQTANSPFSGKIKLSTLVIGDKVTKINDYLFYDCKGLLSVIIPDKVIEIGIRSFQNCEQLETLVLGADLQKIGDRSFENCRALTAISIPVSVDDIARSAFANCIELKTVEIVGGLTTLSFGGGLGAGLFPFDGCVNIQKITLGRNISYYDQTANSPFSGKIKISTLIIGDKVTKINKYLFDGCKGLLSVIIPDKVNEIGEYAFRNCEQLKTLELGCGLQTLGNGAFSGCTKLEKITSCPQPPTIYNNTFNGVLKNISVFINCDYIEDYKAAQYWKEFTNYQCAVPVTDIILDVPNTIIIGESLELKGTVKPDNATNKNIIWSVEGAGATGAKITQGNILTTEVEGSFSIKATIVNGKYSDFTKNFPFNSVLGVTDITPSQFIIYPNPTSRELKIKNGKLPIEEIRIFDIYGRKLQSHIFSMSKEITIDISELPSGIYFVKISTKAGEVARKVLKE